jgi:hypothetical protein
MEMFYELILKIEKVIISALVCAPIVACGTNNIHYIAREDLDSDPLYMLNESDMVKPKNYGALKLQKNDMELDEGNLYILQKKKGIYQAETMIHKANDKRFYFSLGVDYKERTPHIGFRLEF